MKTIRILLYLLAAASLTACYSLAEDITPPPGYVFTTPIPSVAPTETMYFPLMPPNPEAGEAIFSDECAPCHGPSGFGDGPKAAELPNPVAAIGDPELANQRTPEDWFRQVTNGNIDRYMPPFNSLTERQRWDVVAYAFSLSTPGGVAAQGETLFAQNCAECHGATGDGEGPAAADLSTEPAAFTDQSVMAERSLNDLILGLTHPDLADLPPYDPALSETDRLALAAYVRTFTYGVERPVASEPEIIGSTTGVTTDTVTPEAAADQTSQTAQTGEGAAGDEEPRAAGDVAGQVTNVSESGLPADTVVTLYAFDQFQQVLTRTQTIAEDGSFLFAGVEMPEGRAFIAAVEYDHGTYTSDLAVVGPEGEDILLQISVYDSSPDISGLSIDRLHIFFEFLSADTVRVAELILITNPSNQVILAGEEGTPTFEIKLPPDATNLQFEEGTLGNQFVKTADGFGDLRGVSPGTGSHQILFSFDMPYTRRFELNQVIEFPVGALVVLLPDVGVELSGNALVSDGLRDIEGQSFELYTGGGLAAGEMLPIRLSGTPDFGGGASASSSSNLTIGMTALGVVLVGVGLWLFRRQRAAQEGVEGIEGEEPVPEHVKAMNPDDLMDAIIALDDRFKAGDLPESAYLKQRSLLKQRLAEVLSP